MLTDAHGNLWFVQKAFLDWIGVKILKLEYSRTSASKQCSCNTGVQHKPPDVGQPKKDRVSMMFFRMPLSPILQFQNHTKKREKRKPLDLTMTTKNLFHKIK